MLGHRAPYILSMIAMLVVLAALSGQTPAPTRKQFGFERTPVLVDKHQGFVILPAIRSTDGPRPWVWYAPTLGGLPGKPNEWLLKRLLEHGVAICGVDVGESYGSPAGRRVYEAFYKQVIRDFHLEGKARLLAQSRGGLMLYNWAAEHPENVRCIAGIYPVCDLRSYPRLERAAPAYGMTAPQLAERLAEHNPVDRLQALAKAGVPILHLHGDADTLVPLDANSKALQHRYTELGGKMDLRIIQGRGHQVVPEFFESDELLAFLLAGGPSPGPEHSSR